MKRFLVVLFFGVTMVFSGAAFADPEMCGCGKMGKMEGGMMEHRGMMEHGGMREHGGMMGEMMDDHHRMMQMMMTSLGLDEKQKEAIRAIKHRGMKEMIRKKADMEVAEIELKELLGKDPMDMKAVEAKMKQIEGLRTDMHMMFIKAREEVKAQLTPDQKKKMKEMMERHHMMGGMKGGMCGDAGKGMMEHSGMCGGESKCGHMEHHEGMKGGMWGDMGKGMRGGMCGGDCKCGCMKEHEGKPEGAMPMMEHKH